MTTELTPDTRLEMIGQATTIVAAFVGHNPCMASDLPKLIADTHGALLGLISPPEAPPAPQRAPAVPIKKSITADAIFCLECGSGHTSIKRHLSAAHALTPDEYRAKWDLPHDYPMVTAAYSERRRNLALKSGLGTKK